MAVLLHLGHLSLEMQHSITTVKDMFNAKNRFKVEALEPVSEALAGVHHTIPCSALSRGSQSMIFSTHMLLNPAIFAAYSMHV